jgi:glycosyltransferase involved in cell wall biosynthesis
MTEVAGDAAIFFDPADAAGAAEAIRRGLGRRSELIEAGFRNVARFDGEEIADAYCAFYRAILGAGVAQG